MRRRLGRIVVKFSLKGRGPKYLKGSVMMLRAVASIEQWAIRLAYVPFFNYHILISHRWDITARFGLCHPTLPLAIYFDLTKAALDENGHFSLLRARLRWLYGSLALHVVSWESAWVTQDSLLIHEARVHINSKNYRRVFEVVLDRTKVLLASNEDIQKAIETITYDLGKPGSSVEPLFLLNYLPAASPNGQHGHVSSLLANFTSPSL
ncbi:hypothetical protein JAAARDRAFT_498292 [Jaapia argillacea MUCL 33604]|uniref:Uncharacterized protein n=1 Tax=Jaapia argillacea MUCL 33604 TaxID=933084 RepID=A0A067PN62_9AGAM|nr:hypothetical protein JAAARDRAFT_498292 [Jaapia argillacea MUCL 33604]